jgi:hypothetical protein
MVYPNVVCDVPAVPRVGFLSFAQIGGDPGPVGSGTAPTIRVREVVYVHAIWYQYDTSRLQSLRAFEIKFRQNTRLHTRDLQNEGGLTPSSIDNNPERAPICSSARCAWAGDMTKSREP